MSFVGQSWFPLGRWFGRQGCHQQGFRPLECLRTKCRPHSGEMAVLQDVLPAIFPPRSTGQVQILIPSGSLVRQFRAGRWGFSDRRPEHPCLMREGAKQAWVGEIRFRMSNRWCRPSAASRVRTPAETQLAILPELAPGILTGVAFPAQITVKHPTAANR